MGEFLALFASGICEFQPLCESIKDFSGLLSDRCGVRLICSSQATVFRKPISASLT
jgi:hypothetical protein